MTSHALVVLASLPCAFCLYAHVDETRTDVIDVDVGVCLTGLTRTFEYEKVRSNILNHFLASFLKGQSYRTFFALSEIDDKRPEGSPFPGFHDLPAIDTTGFTFRLDDWNGECAVIDDGQRMTRHWGRFNATLARQSMSPWQPVGPRTLKGERNGCGPDTGGMVDVNRWANMFQREQNCYSMVQEFEAEKSVKFKRILFMRPDIAFFGDVTPLADLGLGPDECWLPRGVVQQRYNDHMFLCPRELCPDYLDIGLRLKREDSIQIFDGDMNCYVKPWQDHAMHRALRQMNFRELPLEYTLMRGCPLGLECARVPGSLDQCQSLSAHLCAKR